MSELLVGLLACAALAYVVTPIVRRSDPDEGDRDSSIANELHERKRAALSGILDLEDERDLGKLSDEDFGSLVAGYEAEALDALHALDALAGEDVEREIASIRMRLVGCPHCGAPRLPEEKCSACGRG